MARVKVEKATGAVTVTDYIAVHDVGRVMNRMGIEGQLEGGIQMGLGYALREELAFDAGRQLRDSSLHSYRPFRATEMPVCRRTLSKRRTYRTLRRQEHFGVRGGAQRTGHHQCGMRCHGTGHP